jgi:surface polysaccharide O-acyltransferase-like enzyme
VAITAAATALSLAWWQASAADLIVANTLTLPGFWLLYMVAGLALAPHLAGLGRARARHFALVGTLATVAAAIMFSGFFGMIAPPYPVFQLMLASVIFRPASMAYTFAAISLALLLAFSLRPGRTAALLAGLGQHSYGIYLVHLLVLGIIVNRILGAPAPEQFGHTLWIFRITASWTLCLLLSYAAVRLMSSVPGLRVLVGSKTAR